MNLLQIKNSKIVLRADVAMGSITVDGTWHTPVSATTENPLFSKTYNLMFTDVCRIILFDIW